MANTLKALSALLTYPTEELQAATGAVSETLERDRVLPEPVLARLHTLIRELATGDIYDLQERYVLLFDRTRSLSLHLFEHVHGESRDRGQAMIDLKNLYEQNGLFIDAGELPDFLPLFLEFLSLVPAEEGRALLGDARHVLAALGERLQKRKSAYAAVFEALTALAGRPDAPADEAAPLDEADTDPTDLAALDAVWAEEPVTFGPTASACHDGLVARLRAARRPAADIQ
jgi:nitrate reductase delta subunit